MKKLVKKRYDKSELQWTDSDYLCLFCYDPIYYNVESKKELCANQKCFIHQIRPRIFRYDEDSPGVKAFRKKFDDTVKECFSFSKQFFYNRLYEIRSIACTEFFKNKGLKLDHLLGTNFLLVRIAEQDSWGSSTDRKKCDQVILEIFARYDDLHFIEELELRNFLIDETSKPYTMKYYDEIMEIRKVLGIVKKDKYGPEDVNSFYFLDRQARKGKPSSPHDFTTIFQNHFGLVITTNHLFKYGYFISKIHQYPANTSDLAMLFSLWTSGKPGDLCAVDRIGLQTIFDESMIQNKLSGNFDDFLETYVSGKKFAPIVIHDGSEYHFDYFTLFIFMFYVFSLNKSIEGRQTLSGLQTLNDQRNISAKNFEIIIREKFRNEGYTVFPKKDTEKFEPSFDGQRHEYDCIAIDYDSKIIVLVDAKYEDMAPSSTAGETIVEQAVLDMDDGELLHAKQQHSRRQFFIKNFDNMPCKITQFWNYKIISVVITKHTPLINKHLTTIFMSYEKFKKFDFRKHD